MGIPGCWLIFISWLLCFINNANSSHSNICVSIHCISPGTHHFGHNPTAETCNQKQLSGYRIFGRTSAECSAKGLCGQPTINMYPIYVGGKLLRGWFHIHVNTKDVKNAANTWKIRSITLTGQGGLDQETMSPAGQFTIDLLNDCQTGSDPSVSSVQLVPCYATPANQAEHPNTFVFSALFDRKLTEPSSNDYHINWKMPAQYSCNPLKYISIRVGVALQIANDNTDDAGKIDSMWKAGYLLTMDDSMPLGAPDSTPVFPVLPGTVSCVDSSKELRALKPADLKQLQMIAAVSDLGVAPATCVVNREDPNQEEQKFEIYAGRCSVEVKGETNLRNDFPKSTNPLKCLSTEQVAYKNLPTIEEYINNTRFDLCNCYSPPVDSGSVAAVTEPAVTPEIDYGTQPSLKAESRAGDDSDAEVIKARALVEEQKRFLAYSAYYVDNVKTWRGLLWKCRVTHGSFAVLTFFFFVPVAIFYSRYLKEAFNGRTFSFYDAFYVTHFVLILLGIATLCFAEAGGLAGAVYAGRYGSLHSLVGWVVMLLYIICTVLGPIRHVNCLVTSIVFHVILGLAVYIGGLVAVLTATFGITPDKTSLVEGGAKVVVIVMVVLRIVIDVVVHVFMTIYARTWDGELELDKPRMIFPTVMKIEEVGAPPGTKCRMCLFIIYAIVSALLCAVVIFIMIFEAVFEKKTFKGEQVIFEDPVKFGIAVDRYGLH